MRFARRHVHLSLAFYCQLPTLLTPLHPNHPRESSPTLGADNALLLLQRKSLYMPTSPLGPHNRICTNVGLRRCADSSDPFPVKRSTSSSVPSSRGLPGHPIQSLGLGCCSESSNVDAHSPRSGYARRFAIFASGHEAVTPGARRGVTGTCISMSATRTEGRPPPQDLFHPAFCIFHRNIVTPSQVDTYATVCAVLGRSSCGGFAHCLE